MMVDCYESLSDDIMALSSFYLFPPVSPYLCSYPPVSPPVSRQCRPERPGYLRPATPGWLCLDRPAGDRPGYRSPSGMGLFISPRQKSGLVNNLLLFYIFIYILTERFLLRQLY